MKFRRALSALALIAAVPLAAACGSDSSKETPPPPPATAALPLSKQPETCKGYVALTLDDAPSKLTDQYLDVLKFYGVHATFFDIGENESERPDQARHIAEAGHVIGNHTQTHPHMDQLTKEQRAVEFTEPIRIHEELGLGKFAFWRPPYGGTTPEIRKEGEALGMAEAMWDLDTKDFETPDPKKIASQAEGMKAGDILLMHDGKPQTLAALPIVINHYYEQGLCWGKLATTDKDRKAENGKFYNVHAVAP